MTNDEGQKKAVEPPKKGDKGGRGAPRGATRAPRAPRGATGAQNARTGGKEPERIFIIVNCRDILAGTVGDFTAGELGAFERMLSYVRIFWWVRGGAPLSDFTRGWQASHGIREAEWDGMIKKGQKPQKGKKEGEIRLVDGWLEIVDPWKWLKSPGADDPTKAERQRRVRARKAEAKKAMVTSGEAGRNGGARGATRAPRAPRVAPPITTLQQELPLQQEQPERKRKEEAPEPEQRETGRAADTAGPGNPDTAGPATAPPSPTGSGGPPSAPTPREEFLANPTWEALLKLSLQSLAFGRRATTAQKQSFGKAVAEARGRGATLGMLYRRMKRPRPEAQSAFDLVRQAGKDAAACLAKFREIAKVQSLTWPEIDRMAFDTTTRQGVQQQADWDQARADFQYALADVRTLTPEDCTAINAERL